MAALAAAVVVAALIVSGATSSSSGGEAPARSLHGGSFRTAIDSGFEVVAHAGTRGSQTWSLSSSGARLDEEGIPPAGTIGITLAESLTPATGAHGGEAANAGRVGEAAAQPHAEAPETSERAREEAAIALMLRVVRTPTDAEGVEPSQMPRYRTLGGASAAEVSYEYTYRGRGNVQVDVVARRGGKVYFIELDTELGQIARGEAALTQLLRAWHWF